ncbi:Druantia anti-phage system protein DruA [Fontivita pretiosa]|uniref:Druantia anti-phage system protein DruA n=1 Tax=Fontivita pretiosa TaxID=2989684 RepID=UPI003D17D222
MRAVGASFSFTNGASSQLRDFAEKCCDKTAKQGSWGSGFRNRREVVRRILSQVGLSRNLMNHGIHREPFVVLLRYPDLVPRTAHRLWAIRAPVP